ncbi:sulfate ABC transporter substrate-binding protein [Luteolibacter ambystomatis]|uniref:Sulfate-binding protein n=1 Tax=Luteolibacter ambystomatis TaxID=2824561 RepID=A0A975J2I2_9BACT|nr:sulfate ABC transporter substrate-binding protein [Luteolibacter ambystomatis]QUE52860.1 sulfate ABC transporter substrate-binding protein [Luteolibacter ambystomatis]
MKPLRITALLTLAAASLLATACKKSHNTAGSSGGVSLLNVSYDPTRELYVEFNAAFAKHWKEKTGQDLKVEQSHGGSGKQARAVIDGLSADVVTLALAGDIDAVAKSGALPADWEGKLPDHSSPYTSTIVFVVRKGNPKGIKNWDDLVKPGIGVITPNPKTSGGARWNYLAAWAWASKEYGGDEAKVKDYITKLFKNVPVLDSGARGSTTSFAQRGLGDVLLAWENEIALLQKEFPGQTEVVYPSLSIIAEPPVAVVEKNAAAHGTTEVATEYLKYLYTPEGQEIAAKNFYRPRDAKVADKYAKNFPALTLVNIRDDFGGWERAQKTHFADGGTFDQLYGK